jgi:hypothetical protein
MYCIAHLTCVAENVVEVVYMKRTPQNKASPIAQTAAFPSPRSTVKKLVGFTKLGQCLEQDGILAGVV